ncbi:MAG: SLC13 family permease [Dehalococcoidia bacterium]|nr:SLC13 family permease [Dehalococcoidia bacterium]
MLTAAIILAFTYVGITFTRLPRVNIDRPAAALAGAVAMILLGVLTFDEAVQAVDFHTLALLLGMMLLIAVLQHAGFFVVLASRSLAFAPTPGRLLVVVVVATAVSSAFLVNDVVVLLFTPVVIQACRMLRTNPVPFLLAEAMASNIGSTATIVGNPQNMLIGVTSGISFARFFLYLFPVAALGTVILLALTYAFYRKQMLSPRSQEDGTAGTRDALAVASGHAMPAAAQRLIRITSPVLALTTLGFFLSSYLHVGVYMVALVGGVAAMLVSGIRPSRVIRSVDWELLVFFGGLFVVIGGARHAGVLDIFLQRVDLSAGVGGIISMHAFSAVVSQIVSNVPLTMLVIPLIQRVPGDTLWISLAAGSTLGGNATLIGAVANIIVAEQASRQGVEIKFVEFARLGLPVAALTLGVSVGVLSLEHWLGLLK